MLAQLQAHIEAVAGEQDDLDFQRGQRIKARREELHLTQPAVVEMIEALAWKLPREHPLHPLTAAEAKGEERPKPPVSLRGLQAWERGGGIVWEKAKLLAVVLRMDADALMSGPEEQPDPETPDPFAGQDAVADRLHALEERVTAQLAEHARRVEEMLERQDAILKSIEASLAAEKTTKADAEQATEDAEESRRRLLEAAQVASRIYEDAARRLEAAPGTQAK